VESGSIPDRSFCGVIMKVLLGVIVVVLVVGVVAVSLMIGLASFGD
jgi:hypothetical protein